MRLRAAVGAFAFMFAACVGAGWGRSAPAPKSADLMRDEYLRFLDAGRTPSRVVDFTLGAGGFHVVDLLNDSPTTLKPGARVAFVIDGRSVLYVIVGSEPIENGIRLISAHIDTPALRLDASAITAADQHQIRAFSYGGVRPHQWLYRPLGLVGEVVSGDGKPVAVELGLTDDWTFMVEERRDGDYMVVTGSPAAGADDKSSAATFVGELHRRYGLSSDDLAAAELYLVPRERPRVVGLDRSLIGGHGQDDRVNGYAAWRAITAISKIPQKTAVVWLVDREEVGSTGFVGARSRALEMVVAHLLQARGRSSTEALLHKALGRSEAISADTPACVNPNFLDIHEPSGAPIIGRGPVMFPSSGSRGKMRGHSSHAELLRSVLREFASANAMVQVGAIGKVDQGGGSSVAQFLADRGMDVVDLGICVISMHSPFEVSAQNDLWQAYTGFRAWLAN